MVANAKPRPSNRLLESIKSVPGQVFGGTVQEDRSRDLANLIRESRRRVRQGKALPKGMIAFQEGINRGQATLLDFGLRPLFEALVPGGQHHIKHMGSHRDYMNLCGQISFTEADGTTSRDFADVTHELLSATAMAAYSRPIFIGSQLVTTMPSDLKTERMAKMAALGDEAGIVAEGEPFPIAKRGTDYVDIGEAKKRGFQLPITREAVFFNRTQQAIDDATEVSTAMALRKERRILDVVTGQVQNWQPKQSNLSTNTFQTGGGGDAFDNTVSSNGLTNYLAIDAVRAKARNMVDPSNGERIVLGPMPQTLIPDEISGQVYAWMNAPEHRETVGSIQTVGPNPVQRYQQSVVTNEYVSERTGSGTTWFHGNAPKAFVYKEHWAYSLIRVPANSHYMATHDLVADLVASEFGDPFVVNPRYWFKCTA